MNVAILTAKAERRNHVETPVEMSKMSKMTHFVPFTSTVIPVALYAGTLIVYIMFVTI